jgi:hypothetical protein
VSARISAGALAVLAVLPMLGPLVWEGGLPRLALSNVALGAINPLEQPLTVRAFAGQWDVLLVLGWFGLAYAHRQAPIWELTLVLLGGAVGLLRLGNLWLSALLYVPALVSRLSEADVWPRTVERRQWLVGGLALGLCLVNAGSLLASRPRGLPVEASRMALADSGQTAVFTSWRWAPALQQALGSTRPVIGSDDLGLAQALDYLRVSLAHESWGRMLDREGVGLLVLDAADAQSPVAAQVRTSPDWQVAFDSDGALVARRVAP